MSTRPRSRDLGIELGTLPPGPNDAITDVDGVRVGHATIVRGEGPLHVGEGPVRTGVTVVGPPGDVWTQPIFAGCHRLNGNGELTGLEWVRESGLLSSPIAITNTHSVGVVRDGLIRDAYDRHERAANLWSLPVVGETYDGLLNDIDGHHVTIGHVSAAIDDLRDGPVAEGAVGGGTGMICHEFKGGIGTASRVVPERVGGWTVGVLVQANYGRRDRLSVAGVPVGTLIPTTEVPTPYGDDDDEGPAMTSIPSSGSGSIIVVIATDAPLLPHQLERLAQRAGLGIARMGGTGSQSSGDLFIAFAIGNRRLAHTSFASDPRLVLDLQMVNDERINPIFDATIEATEEAILNALLAADTMTGRDGITAHRLDPDLLLDAMRGWRWTPRRGP